MLNYFFKLLTSPIFLSNVFFTMLILGNIMFVFFLFFFKYISFNNFIKFFKSYWFVLSFTSLLSIYLCFLNKNLNFNFSLNVNQHYFFDNYLFININNENIFFIFTVSIISLFANYHTLIYMQYDQKKEKFVLFLNAFAFSMINLLISKNLLLIFLFWEFLGLTSFFLINHNDTQTQSQKSSYKAFTFNKLSDFFFIMGIVFFGYCFNTLNITDISIKNSISNFSDFNYNSNLFYIKIALIFIFLASVIKSVQIFSFFWLPDSMKAPAPASALIHSATLVAAGFYIFLLLKNFFIFFLGNDFFIYIGILTAIFGSLIAASQYDLKKILAYSTIANCGFMLTLLYLFDTKLFLIYFILHGLFKSACFMLTGNLIILQNHNQDTRLFIRNNTNQIKIIKILFCLIFCLAGAPFGLLYLIKHSYIILLNNNLIWSVYDCFLIFYGLFSLLYAFNFIYKSVLCVYNFKNNFTLNSTTNTQISDLLYSLFILCIGVIFFYLFKFFKNLDFSSYVLSMNHCVFFYIFIITLSNFLYFMKYLHNVGLFSKKFSLTLLIVLFYVYIFCIVATFNAKVIVLNVFVEWFLIILFTPGVIYYSWKIAVVVYNIIVHFFKK